MSQGSVEASASIRLLALLGSARPGNYTAKALQLVVQELNQSYPRATVEIVDPAGLDLPLPGSRPPSSELQALAEKVRGATGVILATPEYHGSYSSVMKLMIDNLGFPSALAGKPVALLGVAAGRIGAIKALEHLRSVASHVGALVLPGPVSVANVQQLFDEQGHCKAPQVEKQIRRVATQLMDYIEGHICPRHALERMARGEPV